MVLFFISNFSLPGRKFRLDQILIIILKAVKSCVKSATTEFFKKVLISRDVT